MRLSESVKVFLGVWARAVITVLTLFGLLKLSGIMFDMGTDAGSKPNASSTTDGETCWAKGGVPQYDTGGVDQNFKDCKFKEDK